VDDGVGVASLRGRSFGVLLGAITAAGAAWRLGYLFVAKWDQPLLLNDSLYYSIQAGLNAEGSWFRDALTGQPGAEHGPLTALYLTPWSLGEGDSVKLQRLAVTLAGIACVTVIGLLARRATAPAGARFAERCGLAAAVIAAAYPNLWINDSLVMSETLAVLLVALALYIAIGFDARPSLRAGVLLGVVAGSAALARSELGLLVPGFAAVALLRSRRRPAERRQLWPVAAMAVAAGLTLLPWTAYNLVRFHRTVLLTTNDGNTLLGANCDSTYYDDVGGWDIRCLPLDPGRPGDGTGASFAERVLRAKCAVRAGRLGHEPGDPDASDCSDDRRELALDYVGDHLDRLPVVVAARLGRLLDVYGVESLVRLDVGEEKARWAVWAGIASWWLLAPAAIAGWVGARRRQLATRWWLVVPVAAVLVTAALFYGAHRIRAPAEPTVVVLAATAIAGALSRSGQHQTDSSR